MPTVTLAPQQASSTYSPPESGRATTLADVQGALARIFIALKEIALRFNAIGVGDATHGSKAGDLDARYITVLTPATPDEVFEVHHFLDREPVGFEYVVYGKPGVLYAPGEPGASGWNTLTIKLACNVSNVTAVVRVY